MKTEKTVTQMVSHYRNIEEMMPNSALLIDTKNQFLDMAAGGDGGYLSTEGISVRKKYYEGKDNEFFAEVVAQLGWS